MKLQWYGKGLFDVNEPKKSYFINSVDEVKQSLYVMKIKVFKN